jgi:hypothetical protein
MIDPRWLLLLAALPSCSAGGRRGEPAGRAVEGWGIADSIGNVVIDPATYHFADPSVLLATAEGAGPRTLSVNVTTGVSPQVSYVGTRTPTRSELSAALGYNVSQTFELAADTTVLVPINAYARVDAYPSYQKATWVVFGFDQAVQGTGVVYKPIGVYFDTCGCIGPDPCGTNCADGFPPGEGPPPPELGARDGG